MFIGVVYQCRQCLRTQVMTTMNIIIKLGKQMQAYWDFEITHIQGKFLKIDNTINRQCLSSHGNCCKLQPIVKTQGWHKDGT